MSEDLEKLQLENEMLRLEILILSNGFKEILNTFIDKKPENMIPILILAIICETRENISRLRGLSTAGVCLLPLLSKKQKEEIRAELNNLKKEILNRKIESKERDDEK